MYQIINIIALEEIDKNNSIPNNRKTRMGVENERPCFKKWVLAYCIF